MTTNRAATSIISSCGKAFFPDFFQEGRDGIGVLFVVLCAVVFDCIPQVLSLLLGGAFLQVTGNGIFPLFHLAVADELSSFVEAMDEDNSEPGFDFDN